jgi:hypothetical protein
MIINSNSLEWDIYRFKTVLSDSEGICVEVTMKDNTLETKKNRDINDKCVMTLTLAVRVNVIEIKNDTSKCVNIGLLELIKSIYSVYDRMKKESYTGMRYITEMHFEEYFYKIVKFIHENICDKSLISQMKSEINDLMYQMNLFSYTLHEIYLSKEVFIAYFSDMTEYEYAIITQIHMHGKKTKYILETNDTYEFSEGKNETKLNGDYIYICIRVGWEIMINDVKVKSLREITYYIEMLERISENKGDVLSLLSKAKSQYGKCVTLLTSCFITPTYAVISNFLNDIYRLLIIVSNRIKIK